MASTRIAFYWPDGRVPELASTPQGAKRGRQGLRADAIPRLARKAHNVAAGSSRWRTGRERPRSGGVGGRDRDRGI